jgi:hypothetical protein
LQARRHLNYRHNHRTAVLNFDHCYCCSSPTPCQPKSPRQLALSISSVLSYHRSLCLLQSIFQSLSPEAAPTPSSSSSYAVVQQPPPLIFSVPRSTLVYSEHQTVRIYTTLFSVCTFSSQIRSQELPHHQWRQA